MQATGQILSCQSSTAWPICSAKVVSACRKDHLTFLPQSRNLKMWFSISFDSLLSRTSDRLPSLVNCAPAFTHLPSFVTMATPSKLLFSCCGVCGMHEAILLECSACEVMRYCKLTCLLLDSDHYRNSKAASFCSLLLCSAVQSIIAICSTFPTSEVKSLHERMFKRAL